MTPEQQRIALAEWAGWQYSPDADISIKHEAIMAWYRPGNSPWQLERLPNYLNDLNAVHELEKKLTFHQQTEYVANLMRLYKDYPMTSAFMATAAQRCEALLKTLSLWKPSPIEG